MLCWVWLVLLYWYHFWAWMNVCSPVLFLPLCCLGYHQHFVGPVIYYPVIFPQLVVPSIFVWPLVVILLVQAWARSNGGLSLVMRALPVMNEPCTLPATLCHHDLPPGLPWRPPAALHLDVKVSHLWQTGPKWTWLIYWVSNRFCYELVVGLTLAWLVV